MSRQAPNEEAMSILDKCVKKKEAGVYIQYTYDLVLTVIVSTVLTIILWTWTVCLFVTEVTHFSVSVGSERGS